MKEVGKHVIDELNDWRIMEVKIRKEDGSIEKIYYQLFNDEEVIPLKFEMFQDAKRLAIRIDRGEIEVKDGLIYYR